MPNSPPADEFQNQNYRDKEHNSCTNPNHPHDSTLLEMEEMFCRESPCKTSRSRLSSLLQVTLARLERALLGLVDADILAPQVAEERHGRNAGNNKFSRYFLVSPRRCAKLDDLRPQCSTPALIQRTAKVIHLQNPFSKGGSHRPL
ncbi:MAG: hypothetical protein PHV93_04385 [Candidatus Pacebacteria bacterium]|nr:hypothetical protein [Candidatus Paceibacterota bacterium]